MTKYVEDPHTTTIEHVLKSAKSLASTLLMKVKNRCNRGRYKYCSIKKGNLAHFLISEIGTINLLKLIRNLLQL